MQLSFLHHLLVGLALNVFPDKEVCYRGQVSLEIWNQPSLLFKVLQLTFWTFGAESNQIIWACIFPDMVQTTNFETIISIESMFCSCIQRVLTQTALSSLVIRTRERIRRIYMFVYAIVELAQICIILGALRSFIRVYFMQI